MERLVKIGNIKAKNSKEIKFSKIGIGFEKLDRDVFNPEKAYDKVAEIGVKKARIQSGWAKCEKEKGVYDFEWLDSIVDNLIERGIEPWICLCYGNPIYTETAKQVFGAVGCPPIFTEEEKTAWINYTKATVERYKGKVNYYEIWNEPDGQWCWKHGPNATELGKFTLVTAKAVKEVNPDAKTIGGVVCLRKLDFLNSALKTGMGKYLDFISYHEYTSDETDVFEKVESYLSLAKLYNPEIQLIQGESGSQSKSGGHGALKDGGWTETKQAKQLARHIIADLICNVHFTSYFSCLDMIEALRGEVNNKSTYLDYGYFGVLGADFDEDGKSTGEYYRKPSFYALQNICSIFSEEYKPCVIPTFIYPEYNRRIYDIQPSRRQLITGGFEKENGKIFTYWYPSNIMTTNFESSISIEFFSEYSDIKLIDVMDGSIYRIPDNMITDKGDGVYRIDGLPVKDTPLLLMLGDFLLK
ncbi:MAG: hypothetical protein E7391_06840 [Ruminococcaceae bacterium]|nr:hypothetical protein [Oscillospiraceae bacterium]